MASDSKTNEKTYYQQSPASPAPPSYPVGTQNVQHPRVSSGVSSTGVSSPYPPQTAQTSPYTPTAHQAGSPYVQAGTQYPQQPGTAYAQQGSPYVQQGGSPHAQPGSPGYVQPGGAIHPQQTGHSYVQPGVAVHPQQTGSPNVQPGGVHPQHTGSPYPQQAYSPNAGVPHQQYFPPQQAAAGPQITLMQHQQMAGQQFQQTLMGQCAMGQHSLVTTYGACGIIAAIVFFPIGLIFLFLDVQTKCTRCGAIVSR